MTNSHCRRTTLLVRLFDFSRETSASSHGLPPRHLQPLPTPDALHAIVADDPAGLPEQCRDSAIPIAPVLAGQRDNRLRQRPFIVAVRRAVPLRAAPLAEQATRLPFGDPVTLLGRRDRLTASVGAQEFPWATSRRICFSSESSATTRFSRVFSFSSSFRRLACASLRPRIPCASDSTFAP